jgi:hypothetical protein
VTITHRKVMFPCPVCHGKYEIDWEWLDGQKYSTASCGVCDYGFIEKGSERHKKLVLDGHDFWGILGHGAFTDTGIYGDPFSDEDAEVEQPWNEHDRQERRDVLLDTIRQEIRMYWDTYAQHWRAPYDA